MLYGRSWVSPQAIVCVPFRDGNGLKTYLFGSPVKRKFVSSFCKKMFNLEMEIAVKKSFRGHGNEWYFAICGVDDRTYGDGRELIF